MSSRTQKILDMVRCKNNTSKDEEIEELGHRQKNDQETLPTSVGFKSDPQIENTTLNELAAVLNNSFDSNSIPDSQHNHLSLSLLDDDEQESETNYPKTRPNIVIEETDYNSDTSDSTNLSRSDFSSDDSVKDPNFKIGDDIVLSGTDSDDDNNIKNQQLSPKSGPSSFHKESDERKESMIVPFSDDVLLRLESETINIEPSNFDLQRNINNILVDTTNINMESPCVENENIERKGRKRKANSDLWQRNVNKLLRNSGKAYTSMSKTKKKIEEKKIGPVCSEKCKLQCFIKFTNEKRLNIFNGFWKTADLQVQRQFIYSDMTGIEPKYRYTRVGSNRKNLNHAYYLPINDKRIRVCKVFFMNTLAVSDKTIRTVVKKHKSILKGLQLKDLRGKHGNQPKIDINIC